MPLAQFIEVNLEAILAEWEALARQSIVPSTRLSSQAVRDHAGHILQTIARDMRRAEPQGTDLRSAEEATFATAHGAIRHVMGFSLAQLVSDFQAMRSVVLRRFAAQAPSVADQQILADIVRFDEGLDRALAESSQSYAAKLAESRDTFLAILGHDLRSPLGSLRSCLHLLESSETVKPPRAKVIEIGIRSVGSMDEMIGQLIDFSRRGMGRGLDVHPRPADLGSLCQSAVEEIRIAHPEISLIYQAEGAFDANFDPPRMRQVLINLLANAVQHGDPEQGIVLEARRTSEGVWLTVTNQGQPIAPEFLPAIFDPLVRLEAADADKPSTSLGLGLFISREIAVAHGGRIDVVSSAHEGTSFSVLLPVLSEISARFG